MRFKIDWGSLIVVSKFTVFALFYFVFEGNFLSTSPRGLIFGGVIKRRVFCVTSIWGSYLEELTFGFYGISKIKWKLSSSVIMFTATKQ